MHLTAPRAARGGGFTLVELLVAIAAMAVLALAAAPPMARLVASSQVRTTSDALQDALRTARAEAVRRGRQVVFLRTDDAPGAGATPSATGRNWSIETVPLVAGEAIEHVLGGRLAEVTAPTTVAGPAAVCFNALGRLVAYAAPPPRPLACAPAAGLPVYDVSHPRSDVLLRVTVSMGGQVRRCDPSRTLSAATPQGC